MTAPARRRRLIEVAFPLEAVSEDSRRDPYQGAPHPRALHKWWAQRPLSACRAFIYESLVDDPESAAEREALLKEVADLASWDAVRKPEEIVRHKPKGSGLTGRELLERARARILRDNGGRPPRLFDPFAGGGSIPLEALRLGCDVEASDLNPVAVLILKGTIEYPQKYGRPLAEQRANRPEDCAGVSGQVPAYIRETAKGPQSSFAASDRLAAYEKNPLAADVRFWGNWMLERARAELAQFYPPDPDSSVPVAYLWSRTVPCANCSAEMPLIRQYWLARTPHRRVALLPNADDSIAHLFRVVQNDEVTGSPEDATTSGGDSVCLSCRQVMKAKDVRRLAREGRMGVVPTAVVLDSSARSGKKYRPATGIDLTDAARISSRLREIEALDLEGIAGIPDEPISEDTLGLRVDEFGLDHWRDLFTDRQLLVLSSLSGYVGEAYESLLVASASHDYASAVAMYLAFIVDRLLREHCTLTRWNPTGEKAQGMFSQQVVSMVWDFAEVNPFGGSVGDISSAIEMVASCVELSSEVSQAAFVSQRPAQTGNSGISDQTLVLTDPPYYAAVDYAGLSDFFYVWLKRSLRKTHSELLQMPLTPKREQAIMASESANEVERQRYLHLMQESFAYIRGRLASNGMAGVVFASIETDAWATLIEGLLRAGLVPDASWPIDTESQSKLSSSNRANLKTSVWMACRPREVDAGPAFLGDLRAELRREVESKLLDFWARDIRGADFFISAIGPALSVFGRHSKVLRPDGSEVTVREFLDLVRRESTRVALQQVLHQDDLGAIDPATRAYVTWAWSYGKAALDAGEAIALCLATGGDLGELTRPHAVAEMVKEKSKKMVKLRSIAARTREDGELGQGHGARLTPLIDELQWAAHLWGANKAGDLTNYRASLGEQRWRTLRMLAQAVAECLPEGDDDRRLVMGMLGSSVTSGAAPAELPGMQGKMELGT